MKETKCDDHGENCQTWPREQCEVVSKKVVKTNPKTGCDKVPKMMCTTDGCIITEVL